MQMTAWGACSLRCWARVGTLLDLLGQRVQSGEELISGGLAVALAAPHHAAAAVIADEREVAMAFSPRDLVDRDLKQVAEPILGGEQLSADALNHPPDRVPVDPRQPAGRGLVGLRRQPRDQVLKIAREPRTRTSGNEDDDGTTRP